MAVLRHKGSHSSNFANGTAIQSVVALLGARIQQLHRMSWKQLPKGSCVYYCRYNTRGIAISQNLSLSFMQSKLVLASCFLCLLFRRELCHSKHSNPLCCWKSRTCIGEILSDQALLQSCSMANRLHFQAPLSNQGTSWNQNHVPNRSWREIEQLDPSKSYCYQLGLPLPQFCLWVAKAFHLESQYRWKCSGLLVCYLLITFLADHC